jgi:hypothetical protein
MDSRIGTILGGRYRITQKIGTGGMGVVYRGERVSLGKPVAIKFLQELFVDNPKFIGRFDREAKTMSKLAHPYCVSVIDFGVDNAPYIVMDWVSGVTLKERLATGRITTARSLRIMHQLLSGISHAHDQGIIHRDIKPDNIMLSEATGVGEHIRIFDFGLAKLLDAGQDSFQSMATQVIGTPNYMSPEQSRGSEVDARSDLYSAGVVLFEMLSGRKPFIDDEAREVLRMQREITPPPLGDADPSTQFSEALEAVIKKALAKAPDDRLQSAAAFSEALSATDEWGAAGAQGDAVPQENRVAGSNAPGAAEPPASVADKRRAHPGAAVWIIALLLTAAGIGWFLYIMGVGRLSAPEEKVKAPRVPPVEVSLPAIPAPTEEAAPVDQPVVVEPDEQPINTYAQVQALMAAGKRDEAIKGLHNLRRMLPRNPHYPFLLGKLFFEKKWWGEGLKNYGEAIELQRDYRKRPILIRDVIDALGNDKTNRKAEKLLMRKIGGAAAAALSKAAVGHKNPKTRKRAARLAKRI